MEEAKKIANNIINNIPNYCENDKLKIFTYVYVKLAHLIKYDDYASELIDMHLGGYDRERAEDLIIQPASTIECLTRGRALCSGYSAVLMYILNELGIETITVISKGKHEWNQVLIDGVWYNCDLTNDADFILAGLSCPHFLKSNNDDCNFNLRYPTNSFEECKVSLSEELQEQLITEAMKCLELEKQEKENEKEEENNIPSFIKKTKSFLSSIKGVFRR